MERYLVTGGAGFIGSAVVRRLLAATSSKVCVVDKLTYAGTLASLPTPDRDRFLFERADVCDAAALGRIFEDFRPTRVMHLAAESHVDRSIDGPSPFVQTNLVGTYEMLSAALTYWRALDRAGQGRFRFHHISTDEVFGALGPEGLFREDTPYAPTSPYSATKAGSDHLVRAWGTTYGLPVVITNCSNNYGPFHFPEKLIPLTILNAFEGRPVPVYGRGENVRDWLYVEDHAEALLSVVEGGRVGESYNIGGGCERRNIEVVETICELVDEIMPAAMRRRDLITFVPDRPGHDLRYAIDASKIRAELGWRPRESFASGLRKTILWYRDNRTWWEPIRTSQYRGERLGSAVGQKGSI